jgi:penicillin-binding protein 1B
MKKTFHKTVRPKSGTRRSRRAIRILKGIFFAAAALTALLASYGFYLSFEIDERFSGRRWSMPSKVFSDTTLLYPGQSVHRVSLEKKLERLGYRKVNHAPEKKGEIRLSGNRWEVFLNDLKVPYSNRQGFPLLLTLDAERIVSVVHLQTGKPVPFFELEPELLMLFFGAEREQRELVSIRELPPHVIHAVLAAEDSRFYEHFGVDPVGILRALYTNVRSGEIREGGSTITQQLAKNFFLTSERTFSRKAKELLLAVTMELTYHKDEILEIYLNEIYLGQKGSVSIHGIGEASRFYFGKPAASLSLDEGAVIAGLIPAPNLYSPYEDRKRCEQRRMAVLQAMHKKGWIPREQVLEALSKPIQPSGYETYKRQAPYFIDYVSRQLASLYPAEALSSLGLSIHTTLDTEVQQAAERALTKGLNRLAESKTPRGPKRRPQGAIVVMQPKTGSILAMVGGRDYSESQFNRLTQAKRQPGSAFKPFVFLCGLDLFTPASFLSNEPATYDVEGKTWRPHNDSPVAEKQVTMRTALAKSINLATVDLAMKVGLDKVLNTAVSFGFSSALRPYPSLALGTSEVIPLELARAYCVFAADGMLPHPLSVKEVTDDAGRILEQRHMTVERVTTPAKAFLISSMLRSAVEEGTGRPLKALGIDFPVAGKTGTTNDFHDAWFVGYTPDLLALVWVGYDQAEPLPGPGSQVALPIWADLVNEVRQHLSGEWFKVPPGIVREEICVETGQLAIPYGCPQTVREFFLEQNTPKEHCHLHKSANPLDRVIKGVRDFIGNF